MVKQVQAVERTRASRQNASSYWKLMTNVETLKVQRHHIIICQIWDSGGGQKGRKGNKMQVGGKVRRIWVRSNQLAQGSVLIHARTTIIKGHSLNPISLSFLGRRRLSQVKLT